MNGDDLERTLGRIEGKLESIEDKLDAQGTRLDNHGKRLRRLELWQAGVMGGGAVVGWLLKAWTG